MIFPVDKGGDYKQGGRGYILNRQKKGHGQKANYKGYIEKGESFSVCQGMVLEVLLGRPRHHGNVYTSASRKPANQHCCSSL